jgi:hypothetical protein
MKSVFQRDMGCLHCRINPKGIKPFIENPYYPEKLSQKTKDKIANMAKEQNRPEECIFCSILLFYWTRKTTF